MDIERAQIEKAVQLVRDLLDVHFSEALMSMDPEANKLKMSISITFDHGSNSPKVKVGLRYARSFKDEAESWVDDPNQPSLIEGEAQV